RRRDGATAAVRCSDRTRRRAPRQRRLSTHRPDRRDRPATPGATPAGRCATLRTLHARRSAAGAAQARAAVAEDGNGHRHPVEARRVKTIDLNADLGEGYDDAAVMPFISSANIACGVHAGDAEIMRRTVELCIRYEVAIGAHPSLPDRQGFGRREIRIAPGDVHAVVLQQIGALHGIARAAGAALHHVKPHGALYNMAARDRALASAIARAVRDFDASLILVGLAGSASIDAAREAGLACAREAFCDRRYRADGSLTPRPQAGSVIEEIE